MSSDFFYVPTPDSGHTEKRTIFRQILAIAAFFILTSCLCYIYLEYRKPMISAIKYMHLHPSKMRDQADIAILITSEAKNVERRQVIRETWMNKDGRKNYSGFKTLHYFVVGYLDIMKSTWDDLQIENKKYGDILPLPSYDNTTKLISKVSEMFYWFHDIGINEFGLQYLLKCDDSTFIRLDELIKDLKEIEEAYIKPYPDNVGNYSELYKSVDIPECNWDSMTKALYWGYFSGNSKYNLNTFAFGGGYILSGSIVSFLANNKFFLRYYHSEDVSVGAWLAPVNNIVRIHDRRFDTEYVSRGCQNYYLVRHNISPEEMREMYTNLKEKQQLCPQEKRTGKEYIYNWSLPPSKCCDKVI